MAAHAGYAGWGIGAVNTQAELRVAEAYEYRAQWIFGAGRDGFDAITTFFLNGFGNMPSRIVGFGSDFMFAQVGLGHGFSDCDRIGFGQLAVGIEEQALLWDIDDDMLA